MGKSNSIYGKWWPTDEILGIPLLLYSAIKGKRIRTLLEEKIAKAKKDTAVIYVSLSEREEYLLEYESLDNFFADHFKRIEKSRNHSFDEMISYCLKQYKKESYRKISPSQIVILQESFIRGAEKTLKLYFLLDKKVHRKLTMKDILIGNDTEARLKKFLIDKKYIDQNQNLIADNKSLFIRLHRLLQDEKYINPDFSANTIMEIMDREYNSIFDKGTFSRANTRNLTDDEKDMHDELLKVLKSKG